MVFTEEHRLKFYCKFLKECDSERILKIGQYLMKLPYVEQAYIGGCYFLAHPVV